MLQRFQAAPDSTGTETQVPYVIKISRRMDNTLDNIFFLRRKDNIPQFFFDDFHTAPFNISRQDMFYFHGCTSFLKWRQASINRDAQSG